MKQVQRGFTLIELVMVIVILGILAAVAMPKFIDLKTDARNGALQGIVGALKSADAINYAKTQITGTAITDCAALGGELVGGKSGTPATGYTLSGGTATTCTLSDDASPAITATFVRVTGS